MRTTNVPMAQVASVVHAQLRGTELLINNYRRGSGGGCVDQKSYVRLSPALGGERRAFHVPALNGVIAVANIGVKTAEFYIYNMRLANVSAQPHADSAMKGILLTFMLESSEPEIKTFLPGCNLDSLLPDLQYNGPAFKLAFTLAKFGNGDLSIGDVTHPRFSGDLAGNVLADQVLERDMFAYVNAVPAAAIRQLFDSADVRRRMAVAMRQQVLNPAGIGKITSVEVAGNHLVITHVPPAGEIARKG